MCIYVILLHIINLSDRKEVTKIHLVRNKEHIKHLGRDFLVPKTTFPIFLPSSKPRQISEEERAIFKRSDNKAVL